jgi:tetratricopeptide (TPR) repeat protein
MNLRALKNEVKGLVAADDLDGALRELDGYFLKKDQFLHDQIIILKSQYSKLKSDFRMGLLEKMEGPEIAKIRFGILQILEEIRGEISSGGVQNTVYLTTRPYIDMENVVGRESDIDALAKTITEANKTVLLNGWGGIGKTTVAKGYLNKYEKKYKYVIWVEVTGQLIVDFLNQVDFDKIGYALNDSLSPELNFKRLIEKLDGLENEKLIIIDNVNKVDDITGSFKYFPQYCKVLITSRVRIPHLIEHKLGSLEPEFAKNLFYKFYKKETDDESLMALLNMVGYHTLTIELLARTTEATIGLNIQKMLQLFTQKRLSAKEFKKINISLLRDKDILESQMYYYILSLFDMSNLSAMETWIMAQFAVLPTLDISSAELIDLLRLEDDPESEVGLGASNSKELPRDTFSFSNSINTLVQKGWLENKDAFYQIHPLVQEVVREKANPGFEMCAELTTSLHQKLSAAQGYFSAPKILFEAPLHNYIAYGKELSYYFDHQINHTLALLNHALAFLLNARYQLNDALFFQLKSLDFFQKEGNDINAELILDTFNSLSIIYRELGNYEAAKEYQLKSIELRGQTNEISLKQAISYRQMAITCKLTGELQAGLSYVYRGLKIIDAIVPEDHPERACSYNDSTAIFLDLGMWDKALEVLHIAREIREKTQPGSRELSDTYNNMASVFLAKKTLEPALEYQIKAVAIMENTAHGEHPVLAHKYSKLSIIYRELGQLQPALEYQLKALKIRVNVFGKTHPYSGHSYNFIALIFFDLKDFESALFYVEQALAIREKTQSEYSTELAESNYNYGMILSAMERKDAALHALEKSVNIYQHNKHPDLKKAQALLESLTPK